MTPQMIPPQATPKKTPVWVWVLAGVAACLLLLVTAVVGLGLFAVKKATELAQHPRELAKMITAADPNLEVVDVDEDKKTIRVRDKSKNTVVTLSLSDLASGKLKITKEGEDGAESVEIGGKVNLPNWVPKFPSVEPRSVGSAHSDQEGDGGIITFSTNVSAEKIRAFYKEGFEKRGLAVKAEVGGGEALVMNSEDGLHATVNITAVDGEQRVTLAYGEKRR